MEIDAITAIYIIFVICWIFYGSLVFSAMASFENPATKFCRENNFDDYIYFDDSYRCFEEGNISKQELKCIGGDSILSHIKPWFFQNPYLDSKCFWLKEIDALEVKKDERGLKQ